MIGRQHGHDAGGGARADQRRAEGDGGAGVAADRLGNDIFLGQLRQLFAHLGRLDLVGDDEDVLARHQGQHAVHRLLQEGAVAEQGEELFGQFFRG